MYMVISYHLPIIVSNVSNDIFKNSFCLLRCCDSESEIMAKKLRQRLRGASNSRIRLFHVIVVNSFRMVECILHCKREH